MADKGFKYEGRIQFFDIEPGVRGDVIKLLDHPDSEEFDTRTLDEVLQQWLGRRVWGQDIGPFLITVEDLRESDTIPDTKAGS